MKADLLTRTLGARFLSRLAASSRGRVFMLKLLLQAEEADEAGIFDHLLSRVDDPELKRIVKRHKSDEERHAQIFRERLAAQSVPAADVPDPVPVIPFIDKELGGFAGAFIGDEQGVMEAYLLLQVIEERGA